MTVEHNAAPLFSDIKTRHKVWTRAFDRDHRAATRYEESYNFTHMQDILKENGVPLRCEYVGTNSYKPTAAIRTAPHFALDPFLSPESLAAEPGSFCYDPVCEVTLTDFYYELLSNAHARELIHIPDVLVYALSYPQTVTRQQVEILKHLKTSEIAPVDALLRGFDADLHALLRDLNSRYFCRVNFTSYLMQGSMEAVRRLFKRRFPQLSVRISERQYAYVTPVSVRHLDSYYTFNDRGELTQSHVQPSADMVRMCPPPAISADLLAELRRRKLRLLLPTQP